MKQLIFILALLMSSTIYAAPILGTVLNNPIYTETDTGEEIFTLTDTSIFQNDATAFLFLENAGFRDLNSFGIVGLDLTKLELFSGTKTPLTSATLVWDVLTNTVTNQTTSMSATIDEQLFGFYLTSGNGNTYYSISDLNPGNVDMMLSFDIGLSGYPGLLGSDFVLAWEDVSGGDNDYNDMVIGISDITGTEVEVSEPTALALMLVGLIGITRWRAQK